MKSPDFFLKTGPSQNNQFYFPSLRPMASEREELGEDSTTTVLKPRPVTKRPPLYKVILLNDDFTPMEFVVLVLKRFFSKSQIEAEKIMLEIHHKGAGVAGLFTFEVAETKVFVVNEFSRRHKYPLKCTMEKETQEEGEPDA